MNVPKVTYEVVYNGKNITADILPHVLSFSYTDKSHGESDEIEILLEDSADLWKNNWYPSKGDIVAARIIHPMQGVLNCGTFEIDDITGEWGEAGDTFSLKGLGAGIKKKVRTKRSYAHEGKTLREIANHVAAGHGLKVEGSILDVRLLRSTQHRETDLGYLKRIAHDFGYALNVRGDNLTFTNIFDLEKKSAALEIYRNEIISGSIKDKTSESYKDAKISFHNPHQRRAITHTEKETEAAYQGAKVDTLSLNLRCENQQQAEIKTKVALYRANSKQQEGNLSFPGNIYAVAGNNCSLFGFGYFSGLYYLESTVHAVAPEGGYTTSAEVKRVGVVAKEQQKKKDRGAAGDVSSLSTDAPALTIP